MNEKQANADCFAYLIDRTTGRERCGALKNIKCEGCPFYKTRDNTNRETRELIAKKTTM